ncbi:hypothetical protein [Xanthomonas vasicola]|uniref:hypothetical protein n=1 Tax=Xanthomonas vasicola TaxID=56459 RepID=UPI0011CE1078|nr:hypothetical protein [Xanthomonas vasicola]
MRSSGAFFGKKNNNIILLTVQLIATRFRPAVGSAQQASGELGRRLSGQGAQQAKKTAPGRPSAAVLRVT